MPTICDVVRTDIPPRVQSRSLRPILFTESGTDHEFDSVYVETGPELYNLDDDPGETTDLSSDPDHSDRLNRLLVDLSSWSLRVRDTLPENNPIANQPPTFDLHESDRT